MGKVVGAAAAALFFSSLSPAPVVAGGKTVHELIAKARSVAVGYDLGDRFLPETADSAGAST